MGDVTGLFLTILIAADVARCESGARFDDAAVVLEVARGRARDSGRSLLSVLVERHQFALGCPVTPREWRVRHLVTGVRAVLGIGEAPAWASEARFYCGPSDRADRCHERRKGRVGAVVHTFFRRYVGGPSDDPEN